MTKLITLQAHINTWHYIRLEKRWLQRYQGPKSRTMANASSDRCLVLLFLSEVGLL